MIKSVTFKIVEILNFGKPTGLFTVRRVETYLTMETSSKIFESTSRQECEEYLNFMANVKNISLAPILS